MTALTFKASGSEESSRSYTASTRRRRPLRSAAVISLSQTFASPELVTDEAFHLITGALLMAKYGDAVLNLEKGVDET